MDHVAAAERLAPRAAELAPGCERGRRLDPGLVQELAQAGLFRLCVPAGVGGGEAHALTLVQSVEALSRGDGAAGWCVAIGATSGLLAGYLTRAAADRIFGSPHSIAGGAFAPLGRAEQIRGGRFRVAGRWPFASGCQHCDWLMGGCVVQQEAGDVKMLPGGMPDVRLMLAPAADVIIHDTWRVSGLRGTGSHDIEFRELEVPTEHSASVFSDSPVSPGPLYAFPLFGLLAVAIAAVSAGIARGALDELAALAAAKTPIGGRRRLADRSGVQAAVAESEAALRAARLLLFDAVQHAWDSAVASGRVPVSARTALRLAATHTAATGGEVAATAYRLGGASALYDSNPLQRRFRDAHAVTQHMLVGPTTWELTGRLLLSVETDVTQL